ncbi:hypothetical protein GGR54DRAFT_640858 [Hypoxylon sp. NC1633]|nr:hypothetical protein GGR54DRAFT_640858 [Hypoxylon sp. NC1633]
MPSFNPFTSVAGRNACTLFEIRLENDFIVLRGNEHEASGQLLKGVLVLCLREQLKVEDIHLRLMGSCRIAWVDGRQTPSGIHNQKVDRTTTVLRHTWPPFVGETSHHNTLAPGNYEWPFEFLLPGDTAESVEGLYQTGINYMLKATISRGKLAKNIHTYKRLRIIRTLEPAALEFNHAMSVENIWPNKIEYSVVIPQKAVVFGSNIPLEMRFTPLLKGLEMGNITVKLNEIQEFTVQAYPTPTPTKSYKHDRDVTSWSFEVTREHHWHDNIEETGQEGWAISQELGLPKRLSKCIQDCSLHGIKIRHKLKLTVALKNPDGHISELRASLPITIFISPNMPLDEEGNLVAQAPDSAGEVNDNDASSMAPPGYGMHVLDQLYEDMEPSGIMTPGAHSGVNSPFYAQSRAGSSENLSAMTQAVAVPPAALSSRLQNVSLDESRNESYFNSQHGSGSGATTPFNHPADSEHTAESSVTHSTPLSRQTSEEDRSSSHAGGHHTPPEHAEGLDMEELSKVPSYATATRTPLPRAHSYTGSIGLPDYQTATMSTVTSMSTPNSPTRIVVSDPLATLATITEGPHAEVDATSGARSRSTSGTRQTNRHSTMGGFNFFPSHAAVGGTDGDRRLRLIQGRSG